MLMLRCIQAVEANDDKAVSTCLQQLATGIRKVRSLLERMHDHCDPQVFYHNIRPLCAGTKDMAAAGLSQGVFYDEGNGSGQWRQYSGGSNAQSSLIQLFDIFLSVAHHATGDRRSSQSVLVKSKGYLEVSRPEWRSLT